MTTTSTEHNMNVNKEFVTRKGSNLMLNGEQFRFAGPNIYWLGLDENVGGVDYPTEFRINNALDTALEMGSTVIRSHTLGASHGSSKAIEPELGVFNEEALTRVDYAMKAIGERGLRVIIPLVDNWNYYHGGRETFTKWRGLTDANQFYTDALVINDFKLHISTIINRVNTYTGIAYKDDPSILAWEVGNELVDTPVNWVEDIVNYIKSIDEKHLVAYGGRFGLDADKLGIEKLDILDAHYYPVDSERLLNDAKATESADKAFIVGEFGWNDNNLDRFLEVVEATKSISGTLYWSLFGHHDQYGYVDHFDSFTLHYPGSMTNQDRAGQIERLRSHAFTISGRPIAEHSVPDAPIIHEATNKIYWRGVVGAAYYTIEKSTTSENGPWNIVCDKFVSDQHGYWIDSSRDLMAEVWYRMKAFNLSGVEGEYSKVYHSKEMSNR